MDRQRFDIELLDDNDPFEIDDDWQRFHLAKHPMLRYDGGSGSRRYNGGSVPTS